MKNKTGNKPQKKKQKPAPQPNDEPGVKYWFVFGQVHFLRAATAHSEAKRKQIRLGEYMRTETLHPIDELREAIRARFQGSPGFDLVEIYGAKEMGKQKWEAKQKPRKPENILATIKLEQMELFTLADVEAMSPHAMQAINAGKESLAPSKALPSSASPSDLDGTKAQPGIPNAGRGASEGEAPYISQVIHDQNGAPFVAQSYRRMQCLHSAPQCDECYKADMERMAKDEAR